MNVHNKIITCLDAPAHDEMPADKPSIHLQSVLLLKLICHELFLLDLDAL